jgi:hypothetical protein
MFHALISCVKNIFDTQIYWKMQNPCDIHSFIGSYFIYQHIYPCVKHVFNAWYSHVKYTNLWMNKLCMIFIINSWHVEFVMSFQKNFTKCNAMFLYPQFNITHKFQLYTSNKITQYTNPIRAPCSMLCSWSL